MKMKSRELCRKRNARVASVLALGVIALHCQAPASAADWAHLRGPAFDGNSLDGQLNATEVTKVWSKLVHNGCSSVTIVGGKLFTMGNDDGSEYVFCLDAATGDELWRFSYECELVPRLYPGGPNATPTVEDGRVYTISRSGHIFCLDAAGGKKIWEARAEKWVPKGGWWGFSGSPTIVGQLVILNVGDKGLALNKTTGKIVWQSEQPAKAYSTVVPVPREALGRPAIVVQTTTKINVLDPQTGEHLLGQNEDWQSRSSNCNGTTPRWFDGALYLLHGKFGLSKLSVDNGRWSEDWLSDAANFARDDWFAFNQQVFYDGYALAIVGGSKRKCRLICLDTKTGHVAWEKPVEFGNLLLAGHSLLMLSQTGELVLSTLEGAECREKLRIKPLEGGSKRGEIGLYWPYPVLLDGHLYARTTKGHLTCLKLSAR